MATISTALQMYDQVGKMQANMSKVLSYASDITLQMEFLTFIMPEAVNQQQKFNEQVAEGTKQAGKLQAVMGNLAKKSLDKVFEFGKSSFQTALQTTKEETKLATLLNQRMEMGNEQIHDFMNNLRDMGTTGSLSYGSLVAEAGVLAESMNDAEALITSLSAKSILPETPEGKIRAFNEALQKVQQTVGDKLAPMVLYVLDSFTPLIDKFNEWLQSDSAQMFFGVLGTGVKLAVDGFMELTDIISELWPAIEPILAMVAGALTLWATTQIPMLISQLWAMIEPLLLQAGTWAFLNFKILLIGAAIGLILYAMLKFGDEVVSIFGFIGGVISAFAAFIWNIFIGVVNSLIQLLWTYLVEPWIGIVEWLFNVFNGGFDSFGDSVANLLGQIISWFLSLGKIVTKIIDAIFGTDWTSGLTSLQDSVVSWGKNEDARTTVRDPYAFSRVDYGDAFSAGKGVGEKVGQSAVDGVQGAFDKVGGFFDKFGGSFDPASGIPNEFNVAPHSGGFPTTPFDENNIDKVREVGKINEKVEVSNEDLTIMRELAEIKNIQNFVSLQPTVSVQTGDINNGYDVDTVVERITQRLEEDIASSARGLYGNG